MRSVKFDYDKDNDDLFLFDTKSKSKGSVEFGDLILDWRFNTRFRFQEKFSRN